MRQDTMHIHAPPLGPGSLIASRYEITSVLGAGGMATVFSARDLTLEEQVALKILSAGVALPETVSRFRSEIKLARRVRHRNVCGIHEYGEDGDLLYISMELVDGVDLRRLLAQRGALPWEEAYDVVLQAAQGLQAIHEEGVIHRDLKTANITRDARGRVRLMDFGIARVFGTEGQAALTAHGVVMGSPEYMSPEQVRGQPLDFRSDLYSLGLVVFEVFTGRTPFRADTPVAAMLQHLEAPPPLDGPEAAGLPRALVPVLRRALAKQPADRFATCAEMAAALRDARDDETPTQAVPPPAAMAEAALQPEDRASVPEIFAGLQVEPGRRRWPVWTIAAFAALLASAYSFNGRRQPSPRTLATMPPALAMPSPAATPAPPDSPESAAPGSRDAKASAKAPDRKPGTTERATAAVRTARVEASQDAPAAAGPARIVAEEPIARPAEPVPAEPTSAGETLSLEPPASPSPSAVFVAPVLLDSPAMEYPSLALRQDVQGVVDLRILVDETGQVADVRVVAGPRELLESAVAHVKRRRYSPASRDGVPIKLWLPISVRFELR